MRLSGALWDEVARAPLRVPVRIATSLLRRRIPALGKPLVEFAGGRIQADLSTPHGLGIYRYGRFDPGLEVIAGLLKAGDVFVDAGANLGQFTLTGARLVGPQGRVFAFEASPATAAGLRANVQTNGYRWVEVVEAALDERNGRAGFTVFEGAESGLSSFAPGAPEQGRLVDVPTVRLQDAVPRQEWERVALIKIDVEGAEARVLRGAEELIRQSGCAVLIEVEPEHLQRQASSAAEVADLLEGFGLRPAEGAAPPNRLYLPEEGPAAAPASS